jgi:NADH dehydrogenase FAD-containing subunit
MRDEITHNSKKIVLCGTVIKSPDVFIPEIRKLQNHDEELTIEVVSANHGYTYKITIYDVITAKTLETGEIRVRYRELTNKTKLNEIRLPKQLQITQITEYN